MLSYLGRLAVACLFIADVVVAAPVTDSRDHHSYKYMPNGKLNWFTDNLSFQKNAVFTDKGKSSYYSFESRQGACPEGTHIPDVAEWAEFSKDRFTGPRKKPNVKSFAGKTRGYYQTSDKKMKVKGKDAAYFAVNGPTNKAMMLDTKRGNAKLVDLPKDAIVNIRCVSERDLYAEKNVVQAKMEMTDPRDGKKYKVEQRGQRLWMTSNLKFSLTNAKQCFLEDTLFCKKYGRFYTHTEAKKACPAGWHLPDDGEWRDFQREPFSYDNMGVGGCRDWDEYCSEANTGHYWSSTSIKKNTGRSWEFRRVGKTINRTDESVQKGLYVRCVAELE